MVKELLISWNSDVGFYHEEFKSELFYEVLNQMIVEYELKHIERLSEVELYFTTKDLNKDRFNIVLKEEDGSDWVYG